MVWKKQFYSNNSEYLYLEITWNNSLSNYPKYQSNWGHSSGGEVAREQGAQQRVPRMPPGEPFGMENMGSNVMSYGLLITSGIICLYKQFLLGRLVSMLFEMVRFTQWLSKMGFQSDLMGYQWNTLGGFMGHSWDIQSLVTLQCRPHKLTLEC